MNEVYERDLDLNLLRIFAVVAERGSVTEAAAQLYLTQPAVSAALRRLNEALGVRLFERQGRGLALTHRGSRLLDQVRPHLAALVEAAMAPPAFDPRTSDHTFRLGLADAAEAWLLPALLRVLKKEAPHMRIISLPVQFRTVGGAFARRELSAAVTVADELPASVKRRPLFTGGYLCLFDPRHAQIREPLRERDYFAQEHVIVSYNGDLRGVVEDMLHKNRKVRCSVSTFHNVGAIVEGSTLLATLPETVARHLCARHPRLRTTALPFQLGGSIPMELLWPAADDDDAAGRFVRDHIVRISKRLQ